MRIKKVILELDETEIGMIHDALEVYLKKETERTYYTGAQDCIDHNQEEIQLANELARDFNYRFTVDASKKLKHYKQFENAEDMIKLYMKVNNK